MSNMFHLCVCVCANRVTWFKFWYYFSIIIVLVFLFTLLERSFLSCFVFFIDFLHICFLKLKISYWIDWFFKEIDVVWKLRRQCEAKLWVFQLWPLRQDCSPWDLKCYRARFISDGVAVDSFLYFVSKK